MNRQLGVFAKHWAPGQSKTRLAETIGAELASQLARAMLAVTLERFESFDGRHVLAFTPPERREEFERLAAGHWELQAQNAGDLGTRMQRFFEAGLYAGADAIVLIGSDSPLLPTAYVEEAFHALCEVPIVLGPSHDGGYYLVGTQGAVAPIFDGIAWSTDQVWRQTIERLAAADVPFCVLPPWHDVDDIEDLRRLRDELPADPTSEALDELRRLTFVAFGG